MSLPRSDRRGRPGFWSAHSRRRATRGSAAADAKQSGFLCARDSQAASGVEPISRCFSCALWWWRSCSMRQLASVRVVTCSAAKRAGRRFCQKWWARSILPLACGVGRVAQGDFVEAQRAAELGEGVWLVGEKEGMIIDIERQREAAGGKGGGKKIEMSQKGLARIKPDQWEEATVVIEQFEQRRLLALMSKPAVGRSVVLPELTDLLDLPATHRLGRFFIPGIGSEMMRQRPTPHRRGRA